MINTIFEFLKIFSHIWIKIKIEWENKQSVQGHVPFYNCNQSVSIQYYMCVAPVQLGLSVGTIALNGVKKSIRSHMNYFSCDTTLGIFNSQDRFRRQ